ncbi:hypothetical protein [Parahaliea mediterranea]|uniref:hypothetical protein n=1 Tax=Parahaliea mediterranea TaxID=651086 RepID=UPI0019D44F1B|nr:hypothetical protein [Parahaliea mediterranea]
MSAKIHSIDATKFGGQPPGGEPLEARVARLEAHVGHIQQDVSEIKSDIREIKRDARTDFRILFGATITATVALVGVMAKGFGWI